MADFANATFAERELTLVRRRLTQVLAIPAEMLELSVAPAYSFLEDSFLVRLRATIYGEELPPHEVTRTAYVPDGWWQHYRADHADRWWMRRSIRKHPVRKREIKLTATWENMAAYPWAQLRTQPTPAWLGDAVRMSWMTANLTGSGDGGNDA